MEYVQKPGPWNTAIKWGVIVGIVNIILGYLSSMNMDWSSFEEMEKSRGSWAQWLGYLFIAVGVVLAQLEHKRKDLGGFISYGRSTGVATIVGLATGVLSAIYVYVYFTFVHPEFHQMVLDATMEKMQDMSPEQEEQVLYWTKMMTSAPSMAIWSFFGSVFVALIAGLITGLFVQKTED